MGVRGAAVLGGIVFALAGLYLFKYSIERGWVSPAVRVTAAMLAGLGALVASQRLRARYEVTAQALGAGGIVVLYAATWASKALYGLVPMPVAFVLMVLVTAVAGGLAVKQDNRLAALLGLVGGFATPLLLSTGENRPIALFSYVLVLDVAVLTVAYLKRWRLLSALALGGTVLLELGWIFTRMEPHQAPIAFAVLGLFTFLFVAFSLRFDDPAQPSQVARGLRVAALAAPTVALVYLLGNTTLHVPLTAAAAFLAVLLAGVGVVHRRAQTPDAALLGVAIGAVLVVLGVAAASRPMVELAQPSFLASVLGLALLGVVNAGWPQEAQRRSQALAAARWLAGGALLALVMAALRSDPTTPHLAFGVGVGVLTLMLTWLGRSEPESGWQVPVGLGAAAAFFVDLFHARPPEVLDTTLTLGPPLVLSLVLLVASLRYRVEKVLVAFAVATGVGSTVLFSVHPAVPAEVLLGLGLLTVLGVVASIRGALPGAALALLVSFGLRLAVPVQLELGAVMPQGALLAVGLGTALVLHALLLGAGRRFHAGLWGPLALALVLPAVFPGALLWWRGSMGTSTQGALAVGLAAVALASALLVRRAVPSVGQRGLMWLLASAATLLAIAVPLQLENQWVTISWAAMAVAHLALWRRFNSRGLKWLALGLLAAVSVRLLLNPEVLDYHQRSGVLFFNWLTYTYLVPAVCLVAAAWLLRPLEVERARGWEADLYRGKVPWAASALVITAALVVFGWVTLSVFDFFSDSTRLSLSLERLPARDVALSLSWIVYAVTLLAVGMWRSSRALRWMSLGFLLVSVGKVFLYDLGQLGDLYRVASLTGLAISLLGISLAYQRFVFKTPTGGTS